MTREILVAAITAVAMVIPRASSAAGLPDGCIVRSIEQAGNTFHLSVDVERSAIEQQLRTSVQAALAKVHGATIERIKLNMLDPTTLHVDADFTARIQVGRLAIELKGTLSARMTIAVADSKAVRVALQPEMLSIDGKSVALSGEFLSVGSQIEVPDLGGPLQSVRITGQDAEWLMVDIDVGATS